MDRLFISSSMSLLTVSVPILIYLVYECVRAALAHRRSPLRDLAGPPFQHLLTGSYERHVWEPDALLVQESWIEKYGPVFKYGSLFNTTQITVMDTKGLNHILTHSAVFAKPIDLRHLLGDILGQGLLFVEGPEHKQQRRVISPAFGMPQIREFTHLFIEKSIELCDALLSGVSHKPHDDGWLEIDVFLWMNKLTLDIIGLAGFNYAFNAISMDKPDEFSESVKASLEFNPFSLSFIIPRIFLPLRLIPTERSRNLAKTLGFVNSIGGKLIAEKKAEILASAEVDAKGGVEKRKIQGHDLLSILIKANMASDIPDNQRMSDADILAQVPTFLIAGHETTSTSLAWTLLALHSNPQVHSKLNAELREFTSNTPTMDELNALPYLDNVVREGLRLDAPVSNTERIAIEDDIIPLSKPMVDKYGVKKYELRVSKGNRFLIPIRAMNRSKELWGEDAHEFKPERWDNVPEKVQAIPSVYSNMLTFIAGAHACVGYRFSVVEMKAILFTFLRAFDFELAVPSDQIVRRTRIVGRPTVASEPDVHQLPLRIRPAKLKSS